MKNTKLLPSVLLMGIAISISYTTETQGVMSLNPPETTASKEILQQETKTAPFAKVMEPAFAEDYLNSNIMTDVQFVATGKGAWHSDTINSYEKKKYITFRALPPGQFAEKNPLSGEVVAQYIMIPKDKGDSIFSAKTGDILTVIGRPMIEKAGDSKGVIFIAASAYKTDTKIQHEAAASQAQPILKNQPSTSQSSQQAQSDKKTDISSDVAMRLERERALAMGAGQKQQNDLFRIVKDKESKRILAMDKSKRQQISLLTEKANNAASKQDFNSTLHVYEEILEIDPDNYLAKYNIASLEGYIALREGEKSLHDKDYQSAIISYKKVLDTDPDNYAANVNIGGAYLCLHEFDLAFLYLNKATVINSKRPESYVNMCYAHAIKGNKDLAFASLQKAVDRGFKDINHLRNDTDLPEDFRNDIRLNNY